MTASFTRAARFEEKVAVLYALVFLIRHRVKDEDQPINPSSKSGNTCKYIIIPIPTVATSIRSSLLYVEYLR